MKAARGFRISLAVILIGLIFILIFSIVVARFYQFPVNGSLPDPSRVAVMVDLFERLSPGDREPALTSFSSPFLQVHYLEGDLQPLTKPDPSQARRKTLELYKTALPTRQIVLSPRSPTGVISAFPPLLETLSLQIALHSGGLLVFQAILPVRTVLQVPVVLVAGLIGAVIALFMFAFLQNQVRPLKDLAKAIQQYDYGRTPEQIPERLATAPEIRTLIRAFNAQQLRLTHAEQARTSLVTGLQHDIRTFATKLRLRLERSADMSLRDQATADLEDIVRLLDDAVLATHGSIMTENRVEEMVDMADLLAADIAGRAGASIGLDDSGTAGLEDVYVIGDRLSLRRIFSNLIDNALVYGSRAEITLSATESDIVISIEDDGPGIPKEKRDLVLEPFVRLEHSRSRATGGFGLGLAIVAKLVSQQRGTLTLTDASTSLKGACVIVELPRFNLRK